MSDNLDNMLNQGSDAQVEGGESTVDPEKIKQMEEATVQSFAGHTMPDSEKTAEFMELERKLGASDGTLMEQEEEGEEDLFLDSDDDLLPLDQEDQEPEPEPEPEPEQIDLLVRPTPQHTEDHPATITIQFYPSHIEIDAENITGLSNARVQRGLQRVFRKLHQIRAYEQHKQRLERLKSTLQASNDNDEILKLSQEVAVVERVVENVRLALDKDRT